MNSEDTATNEPSNATNAGCTTFRLILVDPNKIIVGEHRRPLNPEKVAELERAIAETRFQPAPITIREVDGIPTLVVGAHRLEAVKNLGWSEIPAFVFEGDEREARMWEIDENLRRVELTVAERSAQINEWIKLAEEISAQVETKVGRPESGVNKASRDLGIDRNEAHRAAKIAGLAEEAKNTARDLGFEDNQSALLDAAKGKTAEEQIERLQQWNAKKSAAKAKKSASAASDAQPASCSPLPRRNVDHLQPIFVELEKLLKGITAKEDQEAIGLFIGNLWADTTDAQPAAAVPSDVANEDEPEPAQPEDEPPPTPGVEEPNDRLSGLVSQFNALQANRQKWCLDRLDKPEDAINQVKNNETWRDTSDWLTAFVASTAAEQTAFQAQVQTQLIAA